MTPTQIAAAALTVLTTTVAGGVSLALATLGRAGQRLRATGHDRGDIPGWVMIAIMSAAVVTVLIPFVGPIVGHAFSTAVNNVTNTKSSTTTP